jgi:hypothetical protein
MAVRSSARPPGCPQPAHRRHWLDRAVPLRYPGAVKYEPDYDAVFGGDAGDLVSAYLRTPARPSKREIVGGQGRAFDTKPEIVADEYKKVPGTDFLVRKQETFLAYGGELPFDVLMTIGFDGVESPLLDVRFMVRPDRQFPVTATRARLVPLDALVREATLQHRSVYRESKPGHLRAVSTEERQASYALVVESGRFASRRRISDEDLRSVAEVYRLFGTSGSPTAAVQQELNLPNRNVAKKWVQRARERGFLEPAQGERRGGVG